MSCVLQVDAECDDMANQVEFRRKTMHQDIENATAKKQSKRKEEIRSMKNDYNQVSQLCLIKYSQ